MKIPVVLVSGYFGSGKTTIIHQLSLANRFLNTAVITYSPENVTIVEQIHDVKKRKSTKVKGNCVRQTNTVEQLLTSIQEVISYQSVDCIFLELSATTDPEAIVEILLKEKQSFYVIETIVTVVDASNFWLDFTSDTEFYITEVESIYEETAADLLVKQIEFCNCLILNRCKEVSEAYRDELMWVLRRLQPRAEIVEVENDFSIKDIFQAVNRFEINKVKISSGWMNELTKQKNHLELVGEYGIGSFIYERKVPFHPFRLQQWFQRFPQEILRSKGMVWSLDELDTPLLLSQAGPSLTLEEGSDFSPKKTEIVFIGIDLRREEIVSQLDACLATEAELHQQSVNLESLL